VEAQAIDDAAKEAQVKPTNAGKQRHRKRKPGYVIVAADWVEAVSQIRPHPPTTVALFLLRAFRRQASRQIVVANGALEAWGIGPEAKLHDLREIEAAGLIEIELQPGKAPRVAWLKDPDG